VKRKNWEFPTAYTVLFLILILVTVLTHIIPAGKYNRLSYQENSKEFVIESYGKDDEKLPATQETLDKLNINIDVEKFTNGTIKKPMAIPNTGLVLLHSQSSKVTTNSFTMFELKLPISALSMKREKEEVKRCLLMLMSKEASEEVRDLMTAISQSIIENHLYTEIYKTGNQSIIYEMLNTIFNEKIKKLEN